MFKELESLFSTDSPVAWILGTIAFIYLAIKITKDIINWSKELADKSKKKITEEIQDKIDEKTKICELQKDIKLIKNILKAILAELKITVPLEIDGEKK